MSSETAISISEEARKMLQAYKTERYVEAWDDPEDDFEPTHDAAIKRLIEESDWKPP